MSTLYVSEYLGKIQYLICANFMFIKIWKDFSHNLALMHKGRILHVKKRICFWGGFVFRLVLTCRKTNRKSQPFLFSTKKSGKPPKCTQSHYCLRPWAYTILRVYHSSGSTLWKATNWSNAIFPWIAQHNNQVLAFRKKVRSTLSIQCVLKVYHDFFFFFLFSWKLLLVCT